MCSTPLFIFYSLALQLLTILINVKICDLYGIKTVTHTQTKVILFFLNLTSDWWFTSATTPQSGHVLCSP
jgi:hypothetical protein